MQLSATANAGAAEVLFAVDKVDVKFNVVKVLDDIVKVLFEAVSIGTNSEQHTSSTSPSV